MSQLHYADSGVINMSNTFKKTTEQLDILAKQIKKAKEEDNQVFKEYFEDLRYIILTRFRENLNEGSFYYED